MATEDGADINVHYGLLREFAMGGLDMSLERTAHEITPTGCAGMGLDGCAEFKTADTEASANVMRTVTQARSLLYGIRHATVKIADTYRNGEEHVVDALNSVPVNSADPARIAPELQTAQAQNTAPTEVAGDPPAAH